MKRKGKAGGGSTHLRNARIKQNSAVGRAASNSQQSATAGIKHQYPTTNISRDRSLSSNKDVLINNSSAGASGNGLRSSH